MVIRFTDHPTEQIVGINIIEQMEVQVESRDLIQQKIRILR